jgi:hypothetical protein
MIVPDRVQGFNTPLPTDGHVLPHRLGRSQVASYAGRLARRHTGRPALPASASVVRHER